MTGSHKTSSPVAQESTNGDGCDKMKPIPDGDGHG